ncbi:hypothetical protein E4T47_00933 [Aureobasidium subglaciale]|nr:hypothetical protein E4T47_00933 [Aureobasidium subglaciale]
MGTYKELLAQGLQVHPTAYPVPFLNVNGHLVYTFQRVTWTGNFLDARLECIEVPVNDLPHATNTQYQQSPPSRDMFTQRHPFSKQALAPLYPSPPKRDEHGKFPSKPKNLRARPQKSTAEYAQERSFAKLISTERPLTVDEMVARDSQFLVELHGWMSWASRMPKDWDLLDPAEYERLNSFQTAAPLQANEDTQVDKTSQTLLLFCIVGFLLWYFGEVAAGPLSSLAFLAVAVIQVNNQNGLAPLTNLSQFILNPTAMMNLLTYWILGTLGVVLVGTFAAVTSVVSLLSRVVALLRSIISESRSGSRNAFCSVTASLHVARHDIAREISNFRLATGVVAVMLAFSNYRMLLYPSTLGLLACMLLCLLMVICILATLTERPFSECVCGSPTTPPPAVPAPRASTTLSGRSGVTFADPLATPPSVSTKSLPKTLRPRALIHDFGTPTQGPWGGDFGARRSPPDLFEPTFFSSPPRQTFT